MNVYLDNAATTAVAPEVVEAMVPVLQETLINEIFEKIRLV